MAALLCLPAVARDAARRRSVPSAPVVSGAGSVCGRAIRELQGIVVDPAAYPATVPGFQQYLTATGVRTLTAAQMTAPHHPAIAARYGFRAFLPSREWWPRGAALALLVDRLRAAVDAPMTLRNWWRPAAYNRDPVVGGAVGSDHLTAHSIDLDYGSDAAQARAERWLRALDQRAPWLRLSLGVGARTTHIGIDSPHGRRAWRYP